MMVGENDVGGYFQSNAERPGAIHRAPTQKPTPASTLALPHAHAPGR